MNYPMLLRSILADGAELAPRRHHILELNNQCLEVTHHDCFWGFKGVRPIEKVMKYWLAELAWYYSGDRDPSKIKQHAKLWGDIENPDQTVNSNYGHLVFYNKTRHPSMGDVCMTPFEWALDRLKRDPHTRQATMTYNTGGFNFPENKDYICTQHQHFLIRGSKLDCHIALRSSDAIYGLAYNMPWWSTVHQQLWLRLIEEYPNCSLGKIYVTIYSAHIYAKHIPLVSKMLRSEIRYYPLLWKAAMPFGGSQEWYSKHQESFIERMPGL